MAGYSARISSQAGQQQVLVQTKGIEQSLAIPPRAQGQGSAVNGGELLLLALATCYCNDIYREAGKRGIAVERVDVQVEGDFPAVGEPGRNFIYTALVQARASEAEILELMRYTDTVSEIQNTLRLGTPVTLVNCTAVPV